MDHVGIGDDNFVQKRFYRIIRERCKGKGIVLLHGLGILQENTDVHIRYQCCIS